MKKFTFTLMAMVLSQMLMAQPVLNNNMNFTLGDSFRSNIYNSVFNVVPGPPGENMVWDFEVIDGDYLGEGSPSICVDPSTTHFADSAAVMQSDIAIMTPPTDPDEPYIYQYVTSSNSSREYIAMGMYLEGFGTYATYNEEWIDLKFPMEYGDSFDFDLEILSFSLEGGYYYYHDSLQVTLEADAWGSLITPAESFPSVLRLKQTEVSRSWYKFEIDEPWMFMGEFTMVSYFWFDPNIKVPVMVMHEFDWKKDQAFADIYPSPASFHNYNALRKYGTRLAGSKELEYSLFYLAEYNAETSVNNLNKTGFNIYPNPAQDIVNIVSDEFDMAYEAVVYKQLGKQLSKTTVTNNVLNVSSLKPGIYVLELRKDTALIREKLIIR